DNERVFWIRGLAKMKKDEIFAQNRGYKIVSHDKDVLHFEYENEDKIVVGLMNVGNETGKMEIQLPDGIYMHLVTGKEVKIEHGKIALSDKPVLFTIPKERK
ncbi:MAG: hypothetical protein WBL80_08325, partial [Erysipelotrichaceae bacterium]